MTACQRLIGIQYNSIEVDIITTTTINHDSISIISRGRIIKTITRHIPHKIVIDLSGRIIDGMLPLRSPLHHNQM